MGLASETYETVAVSQTDQQMGSTDTAGQRLKHVIASVATAATSTVSIKDGSGGSSIPLVPANTPIGVYSLEIDAISTTGAWHITTAAGVTVVAIGHFP